MSGNGAYPAISGEIVLASASPSRAALLAGAGLGFETIPSGIDEGAVRMALEDGAGVQESSDVAEILARAKAETVSALRPEATVIGADQILACDGAVFEKPSDLAAARRTLLALAGRSHLLHAAVAVARGGETLWTHTDTARLTMRPLSPEEIGRYLAAAGEHVLASVGAYQLEGLGVHLFGEIDGDYFTVLGLPLLDLLGFLRRDGVLAT